MSDGGRGVLCDSFYFFSFQNAEVKVDEYMANFVKYPEMTAPLNWEGKAKEKEMKSEKIGKIDEMNLETAQNGKTVPRYKILHRGHFDMQNFTLERYSLLLVLH